MPNFEYRQSAILPADPLPIVSIGLGGIVNDAHYPAYSIAGFDVIGGFDINAERAATMQEKFGIPLLYDSLSQAIGRAPDNAVFDVAVPGSAIADILRGIPAGRAVLIQKPMGDHLGDARRLDHSRHRPAAAVCPRIHGRRAARRELPARLLRQQQPGLLALRLPRHSPRLGREYQCLIRDAIDDLIQKVTGRRGRH